MFRAYLEHELPTVLQVMPTHYGVVTGKRQVQYSSWGLEFGCVGLGLRLRDTEIQINLHSSFRTTINHKGCLCQNVNMKIASSLRGKA